MARFASAVVFSGTLLSALWILAFAIPFTITVRAADVPETQSPVTVETVIPLGHAGAAISAIAVSGDGRTAIVGDGAGNTKLWDLVEGKERFRYVGSLGGVVPGGLIRSRDGAQVIVSGRTGMIQVMDARNGRLIREIILPGPARVVAAASFSADAARVAVLMADHPVVMLVSLAVSKGAPRTFPGPDKINAIALAPDGERLAMVDDEGSVRIFDTTNGRVQRSFRVGRHVTCLVFAPDGRGLLVGRFATPDMKDTPIIAEYDSDSGSLVRSYDNAPGYVSSMAYSPDGARLSAGIGRSSKFETLVWDRGDGKPIITWDAAPLAVTFVSGDTVLSGTLDGHVMIRNHGAPGDKPRLLRSLAKSPIALIDSGQTGLLSVAYTGRELVTWSLADGTRLHRTSIDADLWGVDLEGHGQDYGGGFVPTIRRDSGGENRLLYFSKKLTASATAYGEVTTPFDMREVPDRLLVTRMSVLEGRHRTAQGAVHPVARPE